MEERLVRLESDWSAAAIDPQLRTIEQSGSVYLIPETAKPTRLNFAASYFWLALVRGDPIEETIARYAGRFAAEHEEAVGDAAGFILAMQQRGFLYPRMSMRKADCD